MRKRLEVRKVGQVRYTFMMCTKLNRKNQKHMKIWKYIHFVIDELRASSV